VADAWWMRSGWPVLACRTNSKYTSASSLA
jgi:hypothetical protein